MGIDTAKPRLSWVLNSGLQTAYQIVVDGLWDSGKVMSDQSVNVEYAGKPLESRMRCEWKVRVWDADQKESAWSAPATWTMGILHPEDWTAHWISTEVVPPAPAPGEKLTLIKATYAALDGTASADVTAQVEKLVKDGRLKLQVDPTLLGGDPALWHVKELRVIYEVNGERREAAAEDFHELSLPEPHGSLPDPRDEPYVRRTFTLEELPESALATVNVMGFYELYVNGQKVGDDVMSPALSNYHKRSLYLTYDLKPYLRKGRNCIGLWLSRGWYWKVLDGRRNPAVNHDTAIARLQLDMTVKGKPGPDRHRRRLALQVQRASDHRAVELEPDGRRRGGRPPCRSQLGRSGSGRTRLVSRCGRAGACNSGRCPEMSDDAGPENHPSRGLRQTGPRRSRTNEI